MYVRINLISHMTFKITFRNAKHLLKVGYYNNMLLLKREQCGYQDLNLGPRHYQCRALTN